MILTAIVPIHPEAPWLVVGPMSGKGSGRRISLPTTISDRDVTKNHGRIAVLVSDLNGRDTQGVIVD